MRLFGRSCWILVVGLLGEFQVNVAQGVALPHGVALAEFSDGFAFDFGFVVLPAQVERDD